MDRTSYLFTDLDSYLNYYFDNFLQRPLGNAIADLVWGVLVVYVIFHGLAIILQKEEARVMDLVTRAMYVLLVFLVTSWFQGQLVHNIDLFDGWMRGVTQLIDANEDHAPGANQSRNQAFLSYLDNVVSRGNDLIKLLMDRGVPFTDDESATWWGFLVLGATLGPTAVAGGLILVSQLALRLLLIIGPLFVLMLLFSQTQGLFRAWASQVLNAVLACALLVTCTRIVFEYWVAACQLAVGDLRLFNLVHVMGASGVALVFTIGAPLLALRLADGVRSVAVVVQAGIQRRWS